MTTSNGYGTIHYIEDNHERTECGKLPREYFQDGFTTKLERVTCKECYNKVVGNTNDN